MKLLTKAVILKKKPTETPNMKKRRAVTETVMESKMKRKTKTMKQSVKNCNKVYSERKDVTGNQIRQHILFVVFTCLRKNKNDGGFISQVGRSKR